MLIAKRHSSYGSNPWGVFDTETGKFTELERRAFDGPGGFRGYVAFFPRKRDAQAAIDKVEVDR